MTHIVAHFVYAGVRYGVKAISYGLARKFFKAGPAERFDLMGEAWRELVVTYDEKEHPIPRVEDVPARLVDQVVGLASDNDADFLGTPQDSSDSGASA